MMPVRKNVKPGKASKKPAVDSRFNAIELAQEEAATLLAQGVPQKTVANAIGRSRSVLTDWLREDKQFRNLVAKKALSIASNVDLTQVNVRLVRVLETNLDILAKFSEQINKQKLEDIDPAMAGFALEVMRFLGNKVPMVQQGVSLQSGSGGEMPVIEFVDSKGDQ